MHARLLARAQAVDAHAGVGVPLRQHGGAQGSRQGPLRASELHGAACLAIVLHDPVQLLDDDAAEHTLPALLLQEAQVCRGLPHCNCVAGDELLHGCRAENAPVEH